TATVVAHMHATNKPGLAFELVRGVLQSGVTEVAIPVPMDADEATRRTAYDNAMPALRKHLDAGIDVAFVCEGDALFYGSFQYVQDRLAGQYEIQVIPGVTSVSASAAVAGVGLVRGDQIFQVLPATLSDGALAARLSDTQAAFTILKLGRRGARIKALLARLGRLDGAVFVEKATWADQRVMAFKDFSGEAAYFAQVLVPARLQEQPIHAPESVALLCLNAAGLATAQNIRAALPGATLYGLKARVDEKAVDRLFDDPAGTLRDLFQAGTPIVALMASGIVVRALAPLLSDKYAEPPVVALSPDGAHIVPLLGGHHGANRLAQSLSYITGGFAAITTAGDNMLGLALDEPPAGWSVANAEIAKAHVTKRLSGAGAGLHVESGDATWLTGFGAGDDVLVTHRRIDVPGQTLVLHPPTLALGVGCERGCATQELAALVDETLAHAGLAQDSIACVVSVDVKSDETAVLALAERLGVPARFFTVDELNAQTARLKNPSAIVMAEIGCPGVAEGAALAAVGDTGKLLVEKTKSSRATCAVALSPADIDAKAVGRGRGRLFIVGIGPGAAAWRTPAVTRILSAVSDVVGYGFYLDLVEELIRGKVRHTSILSEEEARVRQALNLAAEGRDVALVSSGDVGIYAMATLAFELLDREDRPEWNRLYLQVEPGISAFQAAAARIGAPVGHDFCLISLSDLLTPWEVIERRLKAAAEGGFVVSFYNPVSKRRRTQLADARDILLTHRRPETPVILARQLGRPDEDIRLTTLGALKAEDADMLTLVMVGGEDTRLCKRGQNTWVYTPRGYGAKMDSARGDTK
ncbi:MAG: precorrin-3B C(17)-methyltransferase, partial [Rhodospirillales bacterium]|nr:precorrin-3B C(17)-methyltransferase [Rhodospirillales bacterium]